MEIVAEVRGISIEDETGVLYMPYSCVQGIQCLKEFGTVIFTINGKNVEFRCTPEEWKSILHHFKQY